jgi:hypothetical protein
LLLLARGPTDPEVAARFWSPTPAPRTHQEAQELAATTQQLEPEVRMHRLTDIKAIKDKERIRFPT